MAEAGMSERRIRLEDGRRMFVSESARKEGLPVLFLNSLAADHSMWEAVRHRLERRTVAFDARGHGQSDVVPGDGTLADYAADVLRVMDATGLERAVLCGLSLGGLTAMQVAADAPERVAGLVLANTAVSFPPATMWQERAAQARGGQWGELVEPTLERWLTQGYRSAEPQTATAVRTMLEGMPAEGYAAACSVLAMADATQALTSWDGPAMIIAGAQDQSTPVARAEEMSALVPQAELVVLDAAHVSAIERAEEFAAALERFVARVERD
ncbi:alpha/beta fold hydrolase [Roseitranquillus sediminis]|uniref:alpha/beta fold hydrolase n=1 Tax=Roseitranquillus sediminis TaxID=2809051 RepID=UPI001D0C5F2E|nr:alpha/beta fold hydrolase [Roseitranquillus sediminis]MBM9593184.1 alpha/beta fold hydrolase [Roseitranquillus sediminis]